MIDIMDNPRAWEMYKNSKEGRSCIELFDVESESFDFAKIYEKFCGDPFLEDVDDSIRNTHEFFVNCDFRTNFLSNNQVEISRDNFSRFVEEYDLDDYYFEDNCWQKEDVKLVKKEEFRKKKALTMSMSMFLYQFNGFYKPLLYRTRFDIIQKNCSILGIDLPPIPHSKNAVVSIMYYYDICEIWNAFQTKYNLTDAELCACIYDFATMFYSNDRIADTTLPSPTNVWITSGGGDNGDIKRLDNMCAKRFDENTSYWTCNEMTKRGDIIVMYVTEPYSRIHSIWRANSDGIYNPFDYYQSRAIICEGIKVSAITFNELKDDCYFQCTSILKQKMRGVTGNRLSAEDYKNLFRLLSRKGEDLNLLPKLFNSDEVVDFGPIKKEKDVEEKILIPLLKKLGYNENDWTRQLSLKFGHTEKAVPDFVFFPTGTHHFETSPFVIEAKLDFSSASDRSNAFYQCLSYAMHLNSKIMGICDKERLILYKLVSNTADIMRPFFESTWNIIFKDDDTGFSLNKLIGKDVIKR